MIIQALYRVFLKIRQARSRLLNSLAQSVFDDSTGTVMMVNFAVALPSSPVEIDNNVLQIFLCSKGWATWNRANYVQSRFFSSATPMSALKP